MPPIVVDILQVLLGVIIGAVIGFFVARHYMKKMIKNNPPINPSTVLFGDTSGHNLIFPILVPKKCANVSDIIVIRTT